MTATEIAQWLIGIANHYPTLTDIIALLTTLVTSTSVVCKALEVVARRLANKSKKAATVDADLVKFIAKLDKIRGWIGKVALNPAPVTQATLAAGTPPPPKE